MCNLCGKCRLNNQSKDSLMSTRAQFILLNVCSHVGPAQLWEFGTSSFCLFPSRERNSDVWGFFFFFFSSPFYFFFPYLQGDRAKAQIFVFPGLTHFNVVLRTCSLLSQVLCPPWNMMGGWGGIGKKKFMFSHLRNRTSPFTSLVSWCAWQGLSNEKGCMERSLQCKGQHFGCCWGVSAEPGLPREICCVKLFRRIQRGLFHLEPTSGIWLMPSRRHGFYLGGYEWDTLTASLLVCGEGRGDWFSVVLEAGPKPSPSEAMVMQDRWTC